MEVKFSLSRSPSLAALLSAAGAVAVYGIAWIITAPAPLRIVAAAAVMFFFALAIRRHALLGGKNAARSIAFLASGDVEIAAEGGVWRGQISSAATAPLLTVFVAVCGGGKTFRVLAAFDSLPADSHRQLRSQLQSARRLPPSPFFSNLAKKIFRRE